MSLQKRRIPFTYKVYLQSGGHLVPVGSVEAFSGVEALDKAKKEKGLAAPVVQLVEPKRRDLQ